MKDFLKISFLIILLILIYIYRVNIATFITDEIVYRGSNKVLTYNEYYIENDYIYVQNTDSNKVKKVYDDEQIEFINNYIDEFMNKNLNLSMSNYDKIKSFHDHIVNNTVYDEENRFDSYTAYNLITSGVSICGGYSDIIAIYLNKLGVKNYKITSENHIWNLVELDGAWYHLDATWDDPIASDGIQYLIHNFFIIPTDRLLQIDRLEHNYDTKTYLEAN